MAAVPARNRLLILDSCDSGGFVASDVAVDTSPANYGYASYEDGTSEKFLLLAALSKFNTLLAANIASFGDPEVQVLSAAGSDEFSYDGTTAMANGVFTYYLLEAGETNSSTSLAKGDADGDGVVTVDEAYVYTKAKINAEWNADYIRNQSTWEWLYREKGCIPDFLPHISGGTGDAVLFSGY
jgi:hypothetical protein